MQDIGQSLTNSLARDGRGGMTGALRMNSQRITGVAPGVEPSDAATVSQILSGGPGPAGPSNNTRNSIAELKAAAITDGTSLYNGAVWTWTAGDYSMLVLTEPERFIASDNTPPASGAWVRQNYASLSFGALEPFSSAIGTEVLSSVTSGIRNTGFGFEALASNTAGNENTAFGYRALASATGGADPNANYNTAFGSFALASMTTGYKNAAFGRATSDMLTTGYQNTALGYGAFHWATSAVNCVAVGFEAVHGGNGSVPLTGQGMVGVGFQALYECTGSFNTAIGTSAGRNVTTGARNTFVGTNAGNQQTSASDNIALGYGAGLNSLGSGNIFLGVNSDAAGTLANVTVIGTGLTATASNTMLLGNGQLVVPGGAAADLGSQAKPWAFGIFNKSLYAHSATAPAAGGITGAGLLLSSTPNLGVFFGVGAPTLSAARGSLYLRTDGSSTSNRMYVNADNGSGWTAVTTAS